MNNARQYMKQLCKTNDPDYSLIALFQLSLAETV